MHLPTGNLPIPLTLLPKAAWPLYTESGDFAQPPGDKMDATNKSEQINALYDFTDPHQMQQLVRSIDKFIPYKMLELLGKRTILEIKLGDHVEQELTILFTDIRDFTTLSESMSPEDNFRFINSYLAQMEPLIIAHNGTIDKYIGDAIMAIFASADEALQCSLLMIKQLKRYNEGRQRAGYVPINIGIGLNTGLSMIGTIGGSSRMEGTVISDAVNVASRVESTTKLYHVNVFISENTFRCLTTPDKYQIRFIDRILMKGKTQPLTVYEVFDSDQPTVMHAKLAAVGVFEDALAHYHLQHMEKAQSMLNQIVLENPGDLPAKTYLERCEEYFRSGSHESIREVFHQLEWTDDNQLGIADIDEQHFNLFQNALKLLEAVRSDVGQAEISGIISFLGNYVVEHFSTEEAYMVACGYPFLEIQKREHSRFIQDFTHIKKEIAEMRLSKTYLLFQIQIFLIDWLINHTCKTDKHFGNFYNNSRKVLR